MDVHSHENIDNTEWWLRLCIKHNKSPWAQGVSLTGKIFGSGYLKKKIKKKNKHSTLWSPRKALRVSNSNPLRKTVQWEDMRSDVQEWHKFCPWNPMESWEKKPAENLKYFWSYVTEGLTTSGLEDSSSFLIAFQRAWSLTSCFHLPLSSPWHPTPEWPGSFKKHNQLQWFVIN